MYQYDAVNGSLAVARPGATSSHGPDCARGGSARTTGETLVATTTPTTAAPTARPARGTDRATPSARQPIQRRHRLRSLPPRQGSPRPPKVPGPSAAGRDAVLGWAARGCQDRRSGTVASAAPPRARALSRGPARRLHREHLVEPPAWRGSPLNVRAQERDRAFVRRLRTDDPCAEGQDVHVVVLDALVGGIRVVADRGADAAHLVGGHGRADARAADEDAAIRVARQRSPSPSRWAKSG